MQSEAYWKASEVAEYFRLKTETVWKRARMYQKGLKGGWPHAREGRSVRFSSEDIDAIEELMNPTPPVREPKRKRRSLAAQR